jgi:hypothetical protein
MTTIFRVGPETWRPNVPKPTPTVAHDTGEPSAEPRGTIQADPCRQCGNAFWARGLSNGNGAPNLRCTKCGRTRSVGVPIGRR